MNQQKQPDAAAAALLKIVNFAQRLPGMSARDQVTMATALSRHEPYQLGPDSRLSDGVPRGQVTKFRLSESAIYPGTARDWWLYVPAQCDGTTPARLMVFLDGARYLAPEIDVPTVFDNLIHAGDLAPTIALFVNPGDRGPGLPLWGGSDNRSLEYDALGDRYARFLLEEMLPEVEKHHPLISDPAGRAICGLSSGGLCAFNVAWERPDIFSKVLSHCGSFVSIRGGDQMPALVRREASRPLRVFLQTGQNDLDVVFGHWLNANRELALALECQGYDYRLVIGEGAHSLQHAGAILPETLRWLWRD